MKNYQVWSDEFSKKRAIEKQISRDQDTKDLIDGKITSEELYERNAFLPANSKYKIHLPGNKNK